MYFLQVCYILHACQLVRCVRGKQRNGLRRRQQRFQLRAWVQQQCNDDAIGDNDYDNDESINNSHQIIVDIASLLQIQLPCSLRTRRASGRVSTSPLGIWQRCT